MLYIDRKAEAKRRKKEEKEKEKQEAEAAFNDEEAMLAMGFGSFGGKKIETFFQDFTVCDHLFYPLLVEDSIETENMNLVVLLPAEKSSLLW